MVQSKIAPIFACMAVLASWNSFSAASAVAVAAREADVDGHVYLCTDINWSGLCINYGFIKGSCSTLPESLQNDVSSIGPDRGWECTLFSLKFCDPSGTTAVYSNPGDDDLGKTGVNDIFNSLLCVPSTT